MCEAGVCVIDSEDIENDNLNVNPICDKAKSAPIDTLPSEELLTVQISAPSYFHSLKENPAPPFRKPEKERRPCLLLDNLVTEEEVVVMVAAAVTKDSLIKYLRKYLVIKKTVDNFNLSERDFLVSLLIECMDYAAQRNFSAYKLACLLTIYLTTHLYFKFYYWLPPIAVWKFFKEIMIRYTIEDSPDGQELFSPEECYDILSHFHTIYMSNLPLIHMRTFGVHRLKFVWVSKEKLKKLILLKK